MSHIIQELCYPRLFQYSTHNKENCENICNIVRVFMFQQCMEKHYRLTDSKLGERGSASGRLGKKF